MTQFLLNVIESTGTEFSELGQKQFDTDAERRAVLTLIQPHQREEASDEPRYFLDIIDPTDAVTVVGGYEISPVSARALLGVSREHD